MGPVLGRGPELGLDGCLPRAFLRYIFHDVICFESCSHFGILYLEVCFPLTHFLLIPQENVFLNIFSLLTPSLIYDQVYSSGSINIFG